VCGWGVVGVEWICYIPIPTNKDCSQAFRLGYNRVLRGAILSDLGLIIFSFFRVLFLNFTFNYIKYNITIITIIINFVSYVII